VQQLSRGARCGRGARIGARRAMARVWSWCPATGEASVRQLLADAIEVCLGLAGALVGEFGVHVEDRGRVRAGLHDDPVALAGFGGQRVDGYEQLLLVGAEQQHRGGAVHDAVDHGPILRDPGVIRHRPRLVRRAVATWGDLWRTAASCGDLQGSPA